MLADQRVHADRDIIGREKDLIGREVRCLMDAVVNVSDGDPIQGICRAFAGGLLDVPFAPSIYNRGRVLPVRDNEGFIRLFSKGDLPLKGDIMDFHRNRLLERAKTEGRSVSFQMVTDDIYAISKSRLVGRPK